MTLKIRNLLVCLLLMLPFPWLLADEVTHHNSGAVLPATLPFSEAVQVGNTVYLSGQVGITPGTLRLVEGGIRAEAQQTMANIKTTLSTLNLSMQDIVKCTVMMADIAEWGVFNEVYKTFFNSKYPARSAFGTSGLAFNARVEVECIAVIPEPGSASQNPLAE